MQCCDVVNVRESYTHTVTVVTHTDSEEKKGVD